MALTKARRARLEKLAAYLEGLPEDYRHFDMRDFLSLAATADDDALTNYVLHNGGVTTCGTAACAVGHGPAAGVLMPKKIADELSVWKMWMFYTSLFIGERVDPLRPGFPDIRLFEWLFTDDWSDIDNSHYGAAARIRYLLAHGKPPRDFYEVAEWLDTGELTNLYAPYRIDAKAKADA